MGCDISGIGGGDSDLGDTVYCIARGKVIYVLEISYEYDPPASIIMILHKISNRYYVSLYRHCQHVLVKQGDYVEYLQPISTIGNDAGIYLAHLHFEIRTNILLHVGGGYGNTDGYIDPIKFIRDKSVHKCLKR